MSAGCWRTTFLAPQKSRCARRPLETKLDVVEVAAGQWEMRALAMSVAAGIFRSADSGRTEYALGDAGRAYRGDFMSNDKVAAFGGPMAEYYDRYLVPLNFAPYAEVVAGRAKGLLPRRVLETAAGTGVVTEALARTLPPDATITATDLNQAMIDLGRARPGMERVNWQRADAMKLPFPDGAFDLVVCQFGVMFFPDKRTSFRECLRVLGPGGTHLFVVWDSHDNMPTRRHGSRPRE
jgi:SAM-dependent methyltransferase